MKKTPDSYTSLQGDMFHLPRTDAVYSISNAVVKPKPVFSLIFNENRSIAL